MVLPKHVLVFHARQDNSLVSAAPSTGRANVRRRMERKGPKRQMDEQAQTELCFTPATELRERYRRRELSPVEVAEATLARIERLNPTLNAYVTVTNERALADARAAERAYADGTAGDLAGVPISIKDLTPV